MAEVSQTIALEFDAILFDMDGTLINSWAGVRGSWELFREKYPWIDVDHIMQNMHGIGSVANLRKYCHITDPVILEQEAQRLETSIITVSSQNGGSGITYQPGARSIIEKLSPYRFGPKPRWAICTGATREYALSALENVGIPLPDVFLAAEDFVNGKPAPDPYLLSAEKCGVKPENCLVVEDAPSGILSGRAAGCKVLALLTTHTEEQITPASPDFIVKDPSSVSVELTDSGVRVVIKRE